MERKKITWWQEQLEVGEGGGVGGGRGGEKGPKTSALKHTHLIGNSKILQSVILFSIFFLHRQSNTFQLDRRIYHFQQFLFVCVSGGAAVRKSVHTCHTQT